ncbi:MAG TPA: nuclear transport factor 2 family protein [Actinomycetota bacterium]|nr:nuclear transport factor 2 family protein [Actinomycetota bacterium]
MAHPNEDLLRRGYEAFARGDLQTVGEVFADDIVWHVPGRGPLAGTYRGRDEVMGFFARLFDLSGGRFGLEVHDLLANDEHGVVLVVARGERAGKTLEAYDVHVWHLRDGRAVEYWGHPFDLYAVDEFWS